MSTPLKPLHDQFSDSNTYIHPDRSLNLDGYAGHAFEIWASTPAVLWTAKRPQEKGIHVHVYEAGRRIVDDTVGSVIFHGAALSREAMWQNMVRNTVYWALRDIAPAVKRDMVSRTLAISLNAYFRYFSLHKVSGYS